MNHVLRHLLGFALFVALGIGVFLYLKGAPDDDNATGVDAAASDTNAATSSTDAKPDAEASGDEQLSKATPVSTLVVKKRTLSPELALYGVAESPRQGELSAGVVADVIDVSVFEGSTVSEGDVLVRLDTRDLELGVLQRRAELAEVDANIQSQELVYQSNLDALSKEEQLAALSERELKRAQALAETRVGSEAAIDEALRALTQQQLSLTNRKRAIDEHPSQIAALDARRARAEAALGIAERDLARAVVRAPFDGRILEVNVSPGDRVGMGEHLLSLYDTRFVELRAQLPSRYQATIEAVLARGGTVRARGVAGDKTYNLSISRLGGRILSGSASLDALFRFEDATPPELGRTLDLRVILPAIPNAIALPNGAVRGGDRVYRVIENQLQSVPVVRRGEFQAEDGASRIIVDAPELTDGDRIITSQLTSVVDGMPVLVRD